MIFFTKHIVLHSLTVAVMNSPNKNNLGIKGLYQFTAQQTVCRRMGVEAAAGQSSWSYSSSQEKRGRQTCMDFPFNSILESCYLL